jgi:hypothetical protein
MPINIADFALHCVNQGFFYAVNPHFVMAVAHVRSGIKDDTEGNQIGPFRFTQAEWDAGLGDAKFDGDPPLSAEINNPAMQVLFATVQALNAQTKLVASLKRFPSADELYAAWPKTPSPPPGGSLQGALDNTRSFITTAVDAALEGMDDGDVVAEIDLSSIPAGAKRTHAQAIIDAFAAAEFAKVHQLAALANAIAESDLNPNAVNDRPPENSVGLFQLNINGGVGSGHTVPELKNPAKNSVPAFKAATDLQDAVSVFVRRIEQPANQVGEIVKRFAIAKKLRAPGGATGRRVA